MKKSQKKERSARALNSGSLRAWSKLQHPRRPGEGWEEGRRFATVSGKVPSARLDSFIGDATGVKW